MKRIGVKDKSEIKKHAFFKGLDWRKVERKEYQAPMEKINITEKALKKDETIKFFDCDYGEVNYNENRVNDFSFASSFKEKFI